ncbi:MAG: hypothetical protein K6E29_02750 [Cyanobacteria bacterium RUI128]|nr:hypothetical protein [Cyanobacteria bacterium RUI128]
MVTISKTVMRLDKNTLTWLKRKKVEVPENADTVEHILVPKFTEYTEMFTFKDGEHLRLTQQKNHVNKKTKETEVQIREYDYINRNYRECKLAEVRQTTISPSGEENKQVWRFYHPKDESQVRFSHKGNGVSRNNYIEADGVYTDKNGLKIRPISTAEYYDKRQDLDEKHFVDAPWTLKQSITTKERCGTDSVQECTVVGIYGDKGVSLNHLNPNHKANEDFRYIEWDLLDQLEQQGKNAKAFVIGSCEEDWRSDRQFEKIIDLFATEHVPFSKYKTGDRVLYGPFKRSAAKGMEGAKKFKYGTATRFEWQPGQHLIYDNGEIQLANSVIDAELKKGNTNPKDLVRKSFSVVR